MKFKIVRKRTCNTLVELVYKDKEPSSELVAYHKARGHCSGDVGQSLIVLSGDTRYLILGMGDIFEPKEDNLLTKLQDVAQLAVFPSASMQALHKAIKEHRIKEFAINLDGIMYDTSRIFRIFIEELGKLNYSFTKYKKKSTEVHELELIELITTKDDACIIKATAILEAQNYAKDLINTPANVCTTDFLLQEAQLLAASHEQCSLEYLEEKDMQNLNMGCFLAVSQASRQPGYLVSLAFNNAPTEEKPIVFIGKGIVYDTGGLNLKTGNSMYGMHDDMSGAAILFGVLKAIMRLNLPVNVIMVAALAENAINEKAYRAGDIINSMSGQTVEIVNTDAEGRLILCDAFTYVKETYNPKAMIDIATLTGFTGLGQDYARLFTNNNDLLTNLMLASVKSRDLIWPMPLAKNYESWLDSAVADIKNCTLGYQAGTILAALFLQKFVGNTNWAHLDIPGLDDKFLAKAHGVGLLTQFLIDSI